MASNVSFIIELKNRFSREAEKIRASVSRATVGFGKFDKKVKKASASLTKLGVKAKKIGKGLVGLGKKLALRVSAPAAAFTALSIRGFDKQAKAVAKVNQLVKSTSGAAGLSLRQLKEEATRLQNKTLFGDETILNDSTAVLLSFTNIAKDQFTGVQQAVLDLSTLMKTDLKSSAIQLGKAFNDPVKNLSALSRAGITFDEQQIKLIKGMVKSGNLAKAQTLILKELNVQFGGLAEAAAKVGTGPLTQLLNSMGDAMEQIGEVQFEILKPVIKTLKELTATFIGLSPGVKKFIGITLLVLTVVAPLLLAIGGLVIGFAALSAATAFLGVTFGAIIAPVLIVVAVIAAVIAAGVLLVKHWDAIKAKAKEIWEKIKKNFLVVLAIFPLFGLLIAAGSLVIRNWDKIKSAASSLWEGIKKFFTLIVNLASAFGSKLVDFILTPIVGLTGLFTGVETTTDSVFSSMTDSVIAFGASIIDFAIGPIKKVMNVFSALNKAVSSFVFGADEIKDVAATVSATVSAVPPAKLTAPAAQTLRSQTDINVTLKAPQGVIEKTKTRSTGNREGLNVGMNVADAA